jgi:hypothetical protein
MPGMKELYSELCRMVMGAMAHPLRGIIIEPPDDAQWQSGVRQVTIAVTPSGASFPRTYENTPYSGIGDSATDFQKPPNSGDYVDVMFKGGSTEFPTIVGRHAGNATSQAAAVSIAARAAPPVQVFQFGILSSLTDASGGFSLSGVVPSLFNNTPDQAVLYDPLASDPLTSIQNDSFAGATTLTGVNS